VDRAALVLTSLLPLRSLPFGLRDEAADGLASDFYRLKADTRHTVVESLIVAATNKDLNQAIPSLTGLIWLTDSKQLDLKHMVRGERRRRLTANYRAMLAKGRMYKGHAIESQLGLRRSR
jgi:hypothetical protein